jgi:hypothetical protein
MKCPICGEEIGKEDRKFLFGNDKPYLNVYLHRNCYFENKSNIADYIPKMLEIYRSPAKSKRI